MKRIAIVYTTKTGTTKEAAEIIKYTLEKGDFEVDVMTLQNVADLSIYKGIIIGAPINGFKWVPEASAFVENQASFLKTVPTALFAMNYIGEMGRPSIQKTLMKNFESIKTLIKPLDIVLFGGKIDKELPGPVRLLFGVKKGVPLNVLNPNAIEAWTEKMKIKF